MKKIDNDISTLFSQLNECHSCISALILKRKKDHPVQKLFEAFSLCSGAFYHLYVHNHCYHDLDDKSKNVHHESWEIFSLKQDYQNFSRTSLPPSVIIRPDFRSMCIANAAFRLSAAGELVCDIIQKNDLNECEICKSGWPYQRFFKQDRHIWNRSMLHKNDMKWIDSLNNNISLRNLSLLVALRDEYGHSEFQEGYAGQTEIRDKFYPDHIIDAEIEMLRTCVTTIRFLCENHHKKLTKF